MVTCPRGSSFVLPHISGGHRRIADGLQRQLPARPRPIWQRLCHNLPPNFVCFVGKRALRNCLENATSITEAVRLDTAPDRDWGVGGNFVVWQKSGRSPALANSRLGSNPTFRIRKNHFSHLHCLFGFILEGCKVSKAKSLAMVCPFHCLGIDGRFGFNAASFERRLVAGANWNCNDVLCQIAVIGLVDNAFTLWRVRLLRAETLPASLPERAVANRKLVSVA